MNAHESTPVILQPTSCVISRSLGRAFTRLVMPTSCAQDDDDAIARMFVVSVLPSALRQVVDHPDLHLEPMLVLHGEQDVRFYRSLQPDEELNVEPRISAIAPFGSYRGIVIDLVVETLAGVSVADLRCVLVDRATPAPTGPPMREPRPRRGRERGTTVFGVASHVPRLYAECSGDHNPIHLDDAVAQRRRPAWSHPPRPLRPVDDRRIGLAGPRLRR